MTKIETVIVYNIYVSWVSWRVYSYLSDINKMKKKNTTLSEQFQNQITT